MKNKIWKSKKGKHDVTDLGSLRSVKETRNRIALRFVDAVGNECGITEDPTGEPRIRIGMRINDVGVYLTQEQVKTLLPSLKHFVKTGTIPNVF